MASVAADAGDVVGAVVALWRYPVKSMLGEEINAAVITEQGLLGDRAHALVDASTDKVASAKNPRKWGRLFDCRAAFVEPPLLDRPLPPVRMTLPDGGDVVSGRDDVAAALSDVLGREVVLQKEASSGPALEQYWPDIEGLAERETVTDETIALGAPPGTFFDYAAVHLLTTATLDRLRSLYPAGHFEARRFRPNLVVAPMAGVEGFVENAWVGWALQIGEEVRLRVASPCPRCVMTTLPQGDLPRDVGILRTVAEHNRVPMPAFAGRTSPGVGVYGVVERGGTVCRGDAIRLL
jgi:uncharacterized protein YcbX